MKMILAIGGGGVLVPGRSVYLVRLIGVQYQDPITAQSAAERTNVVISK